VATSKNGSLLVAAQWQDATAFQPGAVYLSHDIGETWFFATGAGLGYYTSVAASGDGSILLTAKRLVASKEEKGFIGISKNYGHTWALVDGSTSGVFGRELQTTDTLTTLGSGYWAAVDISTDGSYIVAVEGSYNQEGYIYTSTDGGILWERKDWSDGVTNPNAGLASWFELGFAKDARYIVPAQSTGFVYTRNDSSADSNDWKLQHYTLAGDFSAVAPSDVGRVVVAVLYANRTGMAGSVLLSTDLGEVWASQDNTAGFGYYSDVAVSYDGSSIVVVQYLDQDGKPGNILVSHNTGTTWVVQENVGTGYWTAAAMSSNGSVIACAQNMSSNGQLGSIWITQDGGITWQREIAAGTAHWSSIASSPDGARFIAAQYGSSIVIKTEKESWSPAIGAGKGYWTSVSSAEDGTILAAAQSTNIMSQPNSGYIHVSFDAGQTWSRQYIPSNWRDVTLGLNGSLLIALGGNDSSNIHFATFSPIPPIGIAVAAAAVTAVSLSTSVGKSDFRCTNAILLYRKVPSYFGVQRYIENWLM